MCLMATDEVVDGSSHGHDGHWLNTSAVHTPQPSIADQEHLQAQLRPKIIAHMLSPRHSTHTCPDLSTHTCPDLSAHTSLDLIKQDATQWCSWYSRCLGPWRMRLSSLPQSTQSKAQPRQCMHQADDCCATAGGADTDARAGWSRIEWQHAWRRRFAGVLGVLGVPLA
jgi:hypothetical protein